MYRILNLSSWYQQSFLRAGLVSRCAAIILTLLASQELLAQENRAPFLEPVTRHALVVGEILDLVVRPFDPDGVASGLNLLDAPAGTTLSDVGNGSGRLQWRPNSSQTGTSIIVLQAVDGVDPSLTATGRHEVTVRSASGGTATVAAPTNTCLLYTSPSPRDS